MFRYTLLLNYKMYTGNTNPLYLVFAHVLQYPSFLKTQGELFYYLYSPTSPPLSLSLLLLPLHSFSISLFYTRPRTVSPRHKIIVGP